MGNSGSTYSSNKGKKFLIKLLYVYHQADEEEVDSDGPGIPAGLYASNCLLADRTHVFDKNFMECRSKNRKVLSMTQLLRENQLRIDFVTVYNSNPLPVQPSDVPIHEFLVFKTRSCISHDLRRTWWSLETNGQQIVLQRSDNKDDVIKKIYDTEMKTSVERLGPIKKQKIHLMEYDCVRNVEKLWLMWKNRQISEPYHLLYSNCAKFASIAFELKKKKIQPKFFAHRYLPENKKLFSFDDIDINSVNPTGDTSLHLALYGEEWELAEEILNRFEDYDVNITNSVGDTPLLLAARLKCEFGLFKKILNRTNSANVNKTNRNENTALHYAMFKKSVTEVEELLKREDVDVDIKNEYDGTALHLASNYWRDIPSDLFNLILEKTTDVNSNSQDMNGHTALHYAITHKSEIMTKALLAHKDVDVNVKNYYNETTLHLASKWKEIPVDLFKIILEQTAVDVNAQDNDRETALHYAIIHKSEIATKKWIKHSDVNVDIKNKDHETAVTVLHLASKREEISSDWFKLILEKSTDINNAQDNDGNTVLQLAILGESEIATKEFLKHEYINVNMKNNKNVTSLHLASMWTNIPVDLFKLILQKSIDINAQDNDGSTALLWAIFLKSEIATKALLAHTTWTLT